MLDDLKNLQDVYATIPLSPMEKLKKSLKTEQCLNAHGEYSDITHRITDEDGDDDSGDAASSAELGSSAIPSLKKMKKKTKEQSTDFNL